MVCSFPTSGLSCFVHIYTCILLWQDAYPFWLHVLYVCTIQYCPFVGLALQRAYGLTLVKVLRMTNCIHERVQWIKLFQSLD